MTSRDILLPPAILDMIQDIQNPRGNIYTQENVLVRLEAVEEACRLAIEAFRIRRARKLGAGR
jgi:hypothetical protein